MTSRAWDDDGLDDGLEDWERDLTRPDGFPLVATLAGSVAIILAAFFAFNFLTIDVIGHVAAVLGVAILVAAVVFAGTWLLTLRHATLGWNVIAGGAFAGIALMCVVVVLAIDAAGTQADARTVRLIKINAQGEPALPPGVKGGPITAAAMDFLRQALVERHSRENFTRGLGLDRLANASAILREPDLVRDCGRFARSAPRIDEMDRALLAKAQAFRARLGAIVKDAGMREALLKGFDDSVGSGSADMRDTNRLTHNLFDQAGPLCTLLSARRWKPMGSMFMFTSAGDLAAFNRSITPWNELIRDLQAVAARQQARMSESGIVDAQSRL
ncbi:hypothetical protein [Sphingomonas bacterium]|uniref:hypothetical protein n=1 Tax=Sphingomonas bacterium TaxID=1895847 RepID=UPI00261854B5|nr:hypothetical protein [Sphingomonas bacterium]MDB5680135.1 hypothetical protein [Sphingomonas bacterium]